MFPSFSPFRASRSPAAFSLVEVVVAVGIFAIAVVSILGLILPNTQTVAAQLDDRIAQRLGQNIQQELQRFGFTMLVGDNVTTGVLDDEDKRVYLVATPDGSRVLITAEDPFRAWNETYNAYKPNGNDIFLDGSARAAENDLESNTGGGTDNPKGIALRDRYFLIEVAWPAFPQHDKTSNPGVLPLTVKILWPYRVPAGPANPGPASKYDDFADLPWRVVPPDDHSVKLFNIALTP